MEEQPMDYEESTFTPMYPRRVQQDISVDGWIKYIVGETPEPIDRWLQQYPPSMVNCADGVSWIIVYNRLNREHENKDDLAMEGLLSQFEKYEESGRPVNFEILKQMASDFGVTSGKWIIFASTGGKIDHIWSIVANGVADGSLPSHAAKVSSFSGGDHCLCIYNEDFTNTHEVNELEKAIRKIGIRCKMNYKPDVYTQLGVYSGNQWGMKPYIYQSMFDVLKGASVITSPLPIP